ncbi:MAG: hypothetical protein A2021_03795 [Elusimicrobia bacterium GWF2_52_66]|nr:MAG: hypothetical protein A2X33_10080 [Elusimicrobia bacterium GWA2_51_34]OGR84711.1 MAG: hypothetical protein A2021_03795 [Elusimicrobia bacterium GWF2_52_66]
MTIYTIGFTKKTAEQFFTKLQTNKVKKLFDIRLNNKSQLAGFAKGHDLEYFLKVICGIGYVYLQDLAPTDEILDAYQGKKMTWDEYEVKFKQLLKDRKLNLKKSDFEDACLLCSEPTAEKCHRRLAAEHLAELFGDAKIVHL